jgi:conserved oligomeric Golgi complex subunit 6
MSVETNSNSPSASQQQITPVQRKLQKILDLKLESDKDLIDSLKYLSSFFTENSVRTRRSLRSTIEKRSLTLNDQFEECFRAVKEQLDQLNSTVTSMSNCCEDMTQRLKVEENDRHIRFVELNSFLLVFLFRMSFSHQ